MNNTKTSTQKLKPADVARLYGVSPATVIGWIKSGTLSAIDVSRDTSQGRPRYLIDPAAVKEFERRRSVAPQVKPAPRRKRRGPEVIPFY